MKPRDFDRIKQRDLWCYATGKGGETLVPQHREGGMGGHRPENPAAIITFDSQINGLIESDSWWQREAYRSGWKLRQGFKSIETPVFHRYRGWLMLDDLFTFRAATPEEVQQFKARLGVFD